jgi:hypothetical protein
MIHDKSYSRTQTQTLQRQLFSHAHREVLRVTRADPAQFDWLVANYRFQLGFALDQWPKDGSLDGILRDAGDTYGGMSSIDGVKTLKNRDFDLVGEWESRAGGLTLAFGRASDAAVAVLDLRDDRLVEVRVQARKAGVATDAVVQGEFDITTQLETGGLPLAGLHLETAGTKAMMHALDMLVDDELETVTQWWNSEAPRKRANLFSEREALALLRAVDLDETLTMVQQARENELPAIWRERLDCGGKVTFAKALEMSRA